jgi:plastocyanin
VLSQYPAQGDFIMLKLTSLAAAAMVSVMFAGSALAADHAVSISGMKFNPPTLEVAAGDTVTFTNEDSAPHTATANDGSFDTGRLSRGESATVTIGAAGTFDYICSVHPSMKGQIVAK